MDANAAIELGRQVLITALAISAPILGIGLVVGVILALFQAITSLNEQTLTMIPKILSMGTALFFLMPYILTKLTDFARQLLMNLSSFGGSL